jgi:hypothetical protein
MAANTRSTVQGVFGGRRHLLGAVGDQHKDPGDQGEDRDVVKIGTKAVATQSERRFIAPPVRIIVIRASFLSVRLHRPESANGNA